MQELVKKDPVTVEKAFDSMNIIITSYGFVLNFYPVYSQMQEKSTKNGMIAGAAALCCCFLLYSTFSIMGFISYGQEL